MDINFEKIHEIAEQAADAAANAAIPTPMIVKTEYQTEVKQFYVSEGACGFAWLNFKGTSPYYRWAKKYLHQDSKDVLKTLKHKYYLHPDYPKGGALNDPLMTQSIARKEAWCIAYAAVLEKHGIECSVRSRLD